MNTPRRLDLSGLKCPLPALKTRRALKALPPGGRLDVVSTDPLASIDIPHLLNEMGHRLEGVEDGDGCVLFRIRKAGTGADEA